MLLAVMHEQFAQRIDEASDVRFNPMEIDALLNRAQEELVRVYYKEFETNEEFRQSLAMLVEVLPVSFVQVGNIGTASIDGLTVPNDTEGSTPMFVLSLNVQVTDAQGRVRKRSVRPHHSNNENHSTNDPFNRPSPREPYLHVEHDGSQERIMRLYVAGDNDVAPLPVIGPSTLRLLRSPRQVDILASPIVECELPAYLHQEIVNRAVSFALENVSSDRLAGHTLLSEKERP